MVQNQMNNAQKESIFVLTTGEFNDWFQTEYSNFP